ncbi:MAG: hypothetical protein ACTSXP_14190 [Promethearchaeota archaeon]
MEVKQKTNIILIINVVFIAAIIFWITLLLYFEDWMIPEYQWESFAKKWELEKDLLFLATGIIFISIGLILLGRYVKYKKSSALLLSIYNLLYGSSSLIEFFGNIINSTDLTNNTLQNMTFFTFGWATLFFYLFLQELFGDSFIHKKHNRTHVVVFGITGFSAVTSVVSSFIDIGAVFVLSLGISIFLILFLALSLMITTLKLRKKADDKVSKDGLLMIALSGLFMMLLIISFVLKALGVSEIFHVIVPACANAWTIFLYLGFIYPSWKRRRVK